MINPLNIVKRLLKLKIMILKKKNELQNYGRKLIQCLDYQPYLAN